MRTMLPARCLTPGDLDFLVDQVVGLPHRPRHTRSALRHPPGRASRSPLVHSGGRDPARPTHPPEGAVNFRDLGGYETGDGRRIRWRTLFRADGLSRLTQTDRAVIRQLGIATVIDLRTSVELEGGRFPVEEIPVGFHHFPLLDEMPDPERFKMAPGHAGRPVPGHRPRRGAPDRPGPVDRGRAPHPPGRSSTAPPARTAPGSWWPCCWACSGWPTKTIVRRLRPERRRHGRAPGEADRALPRGPARSSRRPTSCSRPALQHRRPARPPCATSTARSRPTRRRPGSDPAGGRPA